ncbi:MAG: hypothetical protein P4L51_18245 [Puia sp.]|nr:hypothetical protein [Puia sp.]
MYLVPEPDHLIQRFIYLTKTASVFDFDPAQNIVDFDDLIQEARNYPGKIRQLADLLEEELPDVVSELRNQLKEQTGGRVGNLIHIEKIAMTADCTCFSHAVTNIKMRGLQVGLPKMLKQFREAAKTEDLKHWLWILEDKYRTTADSKQVMFRRPLEDAGLQFREYAQFKAKDELVTDLNQEFTWVIIFIFLCKVLYAGKQMQLELEFSLSSNGNLRFHDSRALFAVNYANNEFF